jgi:lactate permease
MDLFFSVFPIGLLIFLMVKKNPLASHIALPIVALLFYFIKLVYFEENANIINATVLSGLLTAWTPILIIWGAILLFRTMDNSGSMNTIKEWLNTISRNKIAQLMIIGWAFAFLIEGASGFGTPAALAAPVLVGLGFKPVRVAILALIMNTVPVSFGAIGTPTWFGFGGLDISAEQLTRIGYESAFIHFAAALIIPIIALSFVVSLSEIKKNIVFIYLSILSTVIPYFIIAGFNYEFPALIGGVSGLLFSTVLAQKGIGLSKDERGKPDKCSVSTGGLIKASFPLWGTIFLLVITRIHQIGIKTILTSSEHSLNIALGSLGQFSVSPSLVIELNNIFLTGIGWNIKLLYIPALLPFFLISFITFKLMKMSRSSVKETWIDTFRKIKNPAVALMAALIFVKLLMSGGDKSGTVIIGRALTVLIGSNWKFFASYLGAFGSFFAGSNTISNLTFGGIQLSMAGNLGLSVPTILAMQSVGGAYGNMICINNIVAVSSVLGLRNKEGYILKRTAIPMVIYGLIAGLIALIFLY